MEICWRRNRDEFRVNVTNDGRGNCTKCKPDKDNYDCVAKLMPTTLEFEVLPAEESAEQ